MPEVMQLGGLFFRPAEETTFAQDAHLMELLAVTGVHTEIAAGGDVLAAVLRSGRIADFLAAVLVPLDTPWTKDGATKTATHLMSLTAATEKAKLRETLEGLLLGFLAGATPSAATSPSASATSNPAPVDVARRRRAKPAVVTGASSPPLSPTTSGSPSVP